MLVSGLSRQRTPPLAGLGGSISRLGAENDRDVGVCSQWELRMGQPDLDQAAGENSYDGSHEPAEWEGKQHPAVKGHCPRDQRQMLLCQTIPTLLCFLMGFLAMASPDHYASGYYTKGGQRGETIREMERYCCCF